MKDNIRNTELGFFNSYFLPLAARMKERGAGKSVGAKNLKIIYHQVSTCFVRLNSRYGTCLKDFARTLLIF
jgi:hypothetical protein